MEQQKIINLLGNNKIAFFIYLIISLIFFHAFFENITYWGTRDWASHTYQTEIARNTYFNFKQFPLWDPYTSGGLPGPGDPLNYALSPHMLFVFLFHLLGISHIVITFKITMILYVALSAFGVFLISKHYQFHLIASYFAGFIHAFNSQIFLQIGEGTFWFKAITWVPFAVYFFLKSREQIKYVILSGFFLFMIFLETDTYHFAVTLTFLGLWTGIEYLREKNLKIIKILFLVVCLSFFIGALRYFPVMEYSGLNPVVRDDKDSGYTLQKMKIALFDKLQEPYAHHFPESPRGYYNLGMYIGIVPFLFFLVGIFLGWRKYFTEFLIFTIFLFLAFGNYSIIPLYSIFKWIPIFGYFHESARFNIMLMIFGSFFIAYAINKIISINKIIINNQEHRIKEYSAIILSILILYSAYDMYSINTPVLKKIFIAPPLESEKASEQFYQVQSIKQVNPWADGKLLPNLYYDGYGHGDYLRLRKNIGTINANYHSNIANSQVQVKYFKDETLNPNYKGEVYLQNNKDNKGNASIILFTPNRIKVAVNAENDDFVVINQNYLKGWKIKGYGSATELNKLVSHRVKKGYSEVEFYYWPNSFFIGLFVSFVTWICCIIYWFYEDKIIQGFNLSKAHITARFKKQE